jgi:hypothetical protein
MEDHGPFFSFGGVWPGRIAKAMSGKPHTFTVGRLEAVLLKLSLPIGLELERVEFQGEGLTLVDDPFEIRLSKPGSFEVLVTEMALSAFLNHSAPSGMRDFSSKVTPDRIYVEASAMMVVPLKVRAECTLTIQNGKQVCVELLSVDVAGMGAKGLVQKVIKKINPVFDMAEFPVDGVLKQVQMNEGVIRLSGLLSP